MNAPMQPFQPPPMLPAFVETAATAAAAQAKAAVEARWIMALQRPRDWDQVRQDLLRECKRPSFANNKSALYHKPIGKGVEGLGIRFVEVALRCMRNVNVEATMQFEDAEKEIQRVTVTDLESTLTYFQDVKISKTVERSKTADDGSYISMRMNSWGKPVYTVPANDDDLLNKRAALMSKALRTVGLRIIPGDLQDEGEAIIRAIRMDEAARDPDAERKKLADAFAGIGVKAMQLADYLGHDIGQCSPSELVDLRGLYGAIKDGEATWASVMQNKAEEFGEAGAPAADQGKTPGTAAEKVKDALKRRKGGAAPDAAAAAPAPAAGAAASLDTAMHAIDELSDIVKPGSMGAIGDLADQGSDAHYVAHQEGPSAEALRDSMMKAKDKDAAMQVIDLARHLPKPDYDALSDLLDQRFPDE